LGITCHHPDSEKKYEELPEVRRFQVFKEKSYIFLMNILVTGGAGFIGSHIADQCIAAGTGCWVG
jgi:FlaA1/EpsC-like NDP-sugar epimerase